MRQLSIFLIAVVALVGLSSTTQAQSSRPKSKPAEKKAEGLDFKLKDTTGKEHSLSQYKDKIVVLEWIEPGCPVCRRHATEKSMNHMVNKYKKNKNVVILGVCTSSRTDLEGMKSFMAKYKLNYPVLMDTTGAVGRMFKAKKTPHMYVVKNGKIAYSGAMDDDPRGSKEEAERTNYVTDAVDAISKGKKPAKEKTKPYG